MQLPEQILNKLAGQVGTGNDVGLSGASVMVYDHAVLKIEEETPEIRSSIAMMHWLQDKIPVPKILEHVICDGKSYLLMEKATGMMSCSSDYMSNSELVASGLAEALKLLWSVDISNCPKTCSNQQLLQKARQRVDGGEIDYDMVDPATFGPEGFRDARELLHWLEENCPEEEWALCHGDFSLPNIFLDNGHVSCFIDIGDFAIGDKWRDIALCFRSLSRNYQGYYSGKVYENGDPMLLFEKLGITPDWDRIRFHQLLDELF